MRTGETGGGRAVDPGMTAPKRRAVGGTPGLVQWDMMDFDDHPDRAGGAKVLGGADSQARNGLGASFPCYYGKYTEYIRKFADRTYAAFEPSSDKNGLAGFSLSQRTGKQNVACREKTRGNRSGVRGFGAQLRAVRREGDFPLSTQPRRSRSLLHNLEAAIRRPLSKIGDIVGCVI